MNNSVQGQTVTFSVTPDDGTASLTARTAATGSDGRVSTTLTLGSNASGVYGVSASLGTSLGIGTIVVETSDDDDSSDDDSSDDESSDDESSDDESSDDESSDDESSDDDSSDDESSDDDSSDDESSDDGSSTGFSMLMTHSPQPIAPGEGMTFTVEVRENGSPAQGQTVTFSVSPDDGTASLNPAGSTTDSNAQVSTTLTLGSSASGSYTVTASISNGESLSGTVTVETSPPPPQQDNQQRQQDDQQQDDQQQQSSDENQQKSLNIEEQPTTTVELEGISSSHDSVREDDGSVTITVTVTLDKAAGAGGETITLAIVSPTEGKTAKRDEDFDATMDGTLTIAKGQRTGTAQLSLTPQDNTTADGDKAFAVEATSSSGHQALINIRIDDDDEMADEAGDGMADDEAGDGMADDEAGDGVADDEADDGMIDEADGEMAFAFAGAVEDQAYTAGTTITALQLPEAMGGEGEVTYRVFDLPDGLTFDATTRTISGTPEAATDGAVEVTCLAEDSAGTATTLTFSITVNPALSFDDF